jgi:thiamine monophosphate synthase
VTPPFRLLAITPPTGPVPADSLDPWRGATTELAVLLREPGRPAAEILADDGRLAALRHRCRAAGVPMLLSVNLADLAALPELPVDLAGIQLRGDPDLAALSTGRGHLGRLRPTHAWLGRSCHGAPQPGHAQVDYTVFAPVFAPTTAQPGRPPGSKIPAGLAALTAWGRAPGACVYALGGVDRTTAAACLVAGARGLAGIGVFFGEPGRVAQDVAALQEILDAHDRHVEPLSPR